MGKLRQRNAQNRQQSTTNNIIHKIDDEKLIGLVQQNELLYNRNHPHYTQNMKRNEVWDAIVKQLNKNNKTDDENQLNVESVRARWKILRRRIILDIMRCNKHMHDPQKKDSIYSKYHLIYQYISDEYNISNSNHDKTNTTPTKLHDSVESIDLTIEENRDFKMDASYHINDDIDQVNDDSKYEIFSTNFVQNEFLHQNNSNNNNNNNNIDASKWNTIPMTQFQNDEYQNPILLTVQQAGYDERQQRYTLQPPQQQPPQPQQQQQRQATGSGVSLTTPPPTPAPSINNIDADDFQAKLKEALRNESQDEDEMFFKCLIADFKRLPALRKITVKVEMMSAIARAMPTE